MLGAREAGEQVSWSSTFFRGIFAPCRADCSLAASIGCSRAVLEELAAWNQVSAPHAALLIKTCAPAVAPPPEMSGSTGRVKELFRKYGKVALGVHLTVYASFFTGAQPKADCVPRC